jgi:hypothetical protein
MITGYSIQHQRNHGICVICGAQTKYFSLRRKEKIKEILKFGEFCFKPHPADDEPVYHIALCRFS